MVGLIGVHLAGRFAQQAKLATHNMWINSNILGTPVLRQRGSSLAPTLRNKASQLPTYGQSSVVPEYDSLRPHRFSLTNTLPSLHYPAEAVLAMI